MNSIFEPLESTNHLINLRSEIIPLGLEGGAQPAAKT